MSRLIEASFDAVSFFDTARRTKFIIEYSSSNHAISIISPSEYKKTYSGENLFESFKALENNLRDKGLLPMCNGARADVSLSGALSDSSGGAMLYVGDPSSGELLVYIFDEAPLDKV